MKNFTPAFLATLGLGFFLTPAARAQQTVGGSTAPGSTLDVRGSVAANYMAVTAASYAMTATDYYVVYNGTGAGTITLPAAGAGASPLAASFKGRLYSIKNTTAAQTLTVTPAGAETVDGSASITVPAGQSVQLVSTGATSGATWEIVAFAAATSGGAGAAVTASNGLNAASGNVKLGGTLGQTTDVAQAGNDLTLSGAGRLGIGTTTPNTDYRTTIIPNTATQNGLFVKLTDNTSAAQSLKLEHNGSNLIVRPAAAGGGNTVVENTGGNLALNPSGGRVGIGTTTPASTLEVNGSLAANYRTITAATYTLTATDFYVVYNGGTASTFTLPAGANIKGRLYTIKNTTAAQTLTLNAASGEGIDGSTTLSIAPGQSVQVVTSGAASGTATYEIVSFAAATSGGATAAVTASNGLTKTGSDIQLGGTLTKTTFLNNQNSQRFAIGNGTTERFTVMPNGAIGVNNDAPSADRFHLKNVLGGQAIPTAIIEQGNCGLACAQPENAALLLVNGNTSDGQFGGTLGFGEASNYNLMAAAVRLNDRDVANSFGGLGFHTRADATNGLVERLHITPAGNVGIGLNRPGSTLQVNGSLAANYRSVTAATYTLTSTDFYTVYNGSTASTFTLPAAGTGANLTTPLFKGRLYSIKNTTAAQTLTVTANGSETIDGSASITVPAGQSVQLVSTGNINGATWEIVAFAAATNGGAAAAVTASNGLSASSGNVRLGGTLANATTVNLGNNALNLATNTGETGSLIFNGTGTGRQRVEFTSAGDPNAAIGHVNAAGEVNDLYLYSGDDINGAFGPDRIRLVGENIVFQSFNAIGGNNTLANAESNTNTVTNMLIGSNGNVGIGTTTLTGRLNVSGAMGASYTGGVNITNTSAISGNTANQTLSITPGYIANTGTTGNVPVATYDLPGTGNHIFSDNVIPDGNNIYDLGSTANRWRTVYAVNALNTSDRRAKKDIQNIRFGLAEVLKLRPVSYNWKVGSTMPQLGFIAQEVAPLIPDAVLAPQTANELYAMNYNAFLPVLTKAIQEQQAQIEALKAANAKLQAQADAATKAQADGAAKAQAELHDVQASLHTLAEQVRLLQAGGATATTK